MLIRLALVLLTSALALAVAVAAYAAPGDLDGTFSANGKVQTNFTPSFDGATGVAIQVDGKIVAAGSAAGGGRRFALARYNIDGTLDLTFGGDGKVTTNFTSSNDGAADVAIQDDGKIVAGGRAGASFALARYNTDGTLDTTFSEDGKEETDFPNSSFSLGHALLIDADGRIVLAGETDFMFSLARYNTDGTLDTSFGVDGFVTTEFGQEAAIFGLDADSDGKLIAAGTTESTGEPTSASFALARYNTDGTLDATFSAPDGKVTTKFTTRAARASDVAVDASGNIVVAGSVMFRTNSRFALARFESNGTLDASFSGNGRLATNFTTGFDGARSVAIEASGKIVAAGSAAGGGGRFALARYTTGGTLDATFSSDGKVTTNFTSGVDQANALAIQADGKIVAAGFAGLSDERFALARYQSD